MSWDVFEAMSCWNLGVSPGDSPLWRSAHMKVVTGKWRSIPKHLQQYPPQLIKLSLWVNDWNGPSHKTPKTTIIDLLREISWSHARSKPPESLTQRFWSQGAKLAKATNAKVGVSSLQLKTLLHHGEQANSAKSSSNSVIPSRFVIQEQGEKNKK